MGLDPGYRTGCVGRGRPDRKVRYRVIYPHKPQERIRESGEIVTRLIRKHEVNVIAIGNGTASKESEIFIANLLKTIPEDVKYIVVSEAGASVYSASKLGAEEFPDFDVTQRSAVSIARRLQDPLAELVKIDEIHRGGAVPARHEAGKTGAALSGVVEGCVNAVGVDLNTASYSLLSYISGINATAVKNIVKHREEHGAFNSRAEILRVPKIGGPEQCAGLWVPGSAEILTTLECTPSHTTPRGLLGMPDTLKKMSAQAASRFSR